MIIKKPRNVARKKRHYRLRRYILGTPVRPRLNVFRSKKHIYAQIIDDTNGKTLVSASTKEKDFEKKSGKEAAKSVGLTVGKRAIQQGLSEIVFDRGGYLYHGRVKELAEGARESGLKF